MSRPYLSASSFRSHRLIATASERSEVRNEISSLKPVCFRSRGRTSFSRVRVNSPAVLAFRWMDTLRAYISRLLGYSDVNLDDYDVCLCLLHLSRGSVHPAHATAAGHRGHLLLLLLLRHHALGGGEQSRNGRGVLQRRAGDLRRVDDAGRDQILELVGLGVVAVVQLGRLLHLSHDDCVLGTRVLHDDPDRFLERAADDLDAGLLVVIAAPDLVERLLAPQERNAAARHDALLDRGAGRMQRVLDPGLLLLHFGLGGRAHVDHGDAARELREPLLQLLLVVIRRGLLDCRLDLADAALDVGLLALATDDRGVVLVDDDQLCVAEIVEHGVLELRPSSSEITLPPVRTAISVSISLRRSPKPGAFTAHTFSVPRSLLTTSVASASPSTSSATMSSGLPACATFSRTGSRSFIEEIFLSCTRMYGSSSTASIFSGSVMK